MKKLAIILSVLLALSMVLTACGSNDDAANDDGNGNDTAQSADVNPDGGSDQATAPSDKDKDGAKSDAKDGNGKYSAPAKTVIYGTWKCSAVDLMGNGEMMSAAEFKKEYQEDLGKMYVLEFKKDGTATLTTNIGDETGVGEFTFKETAGKYTMIEKGVEDVDGYDQAVVAEIHNKTLLLTISGRIADEDQQYSITIKFEFEKTSK